MITSKIKEVVSVKPHENNYGITLYHSLIMENGDKINIGKKKDQQVGWELTYEVIEEGQQEFNKAKAIVPENFKSKQSNGQVSYKKKDDVQNLIVRQSSLKAAVDYCRGSSCSPEEVCENAELFARWVWGKKMEVINETNEGIKESNNDLPF
tara:strand:- start:194 stop:649 length:456 start_codon:yes stop_codon:yes gene_type:complete